MSDPGYVGNVPPAVPAGTLTNPVAPDAQVPTSTSARMLDTERASNGAGMLMYNPLLTYPAGSVGRAIHDAGLGTAPWGNITGNINDQLDLMAQFATRDNNLTNHVNNTSNPHAVTKAQVGLPNVDNTADANKPVSTPQQNALDLKLNRQNPIVLDTLTVAAGTTLVPPFKWQAGAILAAPVAHAFEWDGTDLRVTNAAVTRKRLALLDPATAGAPTALGGSILTAADVPSIQSVLGLNGQIAFRSLFGNGGMESNILQQAAATTSGLHYVDGVISQNLGTARLTFQQSTSNPATGYPFNLLATVTTAGAPAATDAHTHVIPIEGTFLRKLGFGAAGASSIVAQFLVRSSITGTFAVSLRNNAANRSYVSTFTINSANTWELKTFVIPGDTSGVWPTGASTAAYFTVGMAVGSTLQTSTLNAWQAGNFIGATGQTQLTSTNGATFQATALDLTPGSVVLPPEVLPLDVTLLRMQRYFEGSLPYGSALGSVTPSGQLRLFAVTASSAVTANGRYRVPKMGSPTAVQVNSPGTGAANAVRSTSSGTDVAINSVTATQEDINQIGSAGLFTPGQWYEAQYIVNSRLT